MMQIDPLVAEAASLPGAVDDSTVISSYILDGRLVVASRYGDDKWLFVNLPTNLQKSCCQIYWGRFPANLRSVLKTVCYRYLMRGRVGMARPSDRAIVLWAVDMKPFIDYLASQGITRLSDVRADACQSYVEACRRRTRSTKHGEKPLAASYLGHLYGAVEKLYELSQFTDDAMPEHPWPDTSYSQLAKLTGAGTGKRGGKTPLIPDDVFSTLFQRAWSMVEGAAPLLDLRDEWLPIRARDGQDWDAGTASKLLSALVKERGWSGAAEFSQALRDIRPACYIVIASLSGCRNHELAFLESGAVRSTLEPSDRDGEEPRRYWWMKAKSTKTGEGVTEWMIPEAAVTAIRVLERWAAPYRAQLDREIAARREANPDDVEIAAALQHRKAIFLASEPRRGGQVRTLSNQMVNLDLRRFAQACDLDWELASHQFRRKFANYAARSQFGDLRYLKQHFKHWSMDMTLGYALNESQEMALYAEIQEELDDIKAGVVESWLEPSAPLAGRYGQRIAAWRGTNPVTMFKSHKHMARSLAESTPIRSNGHAWCTADDDLCVGNDIERTRCSTCNDAVIGARHRPIYRGLLEHLDEVAASDDIGPGGLKAVERDRRRCQGVLLSLGDAGVAA
jgi:site-specific recombinase XerD